MTQDSVQIEKSHQLSTYNGSWYLRLYKQSQDNLVRLQKVLESCLNGFWLGVLTYSSLQEIDEIYYSNDKSYYSSEYNKKGLKEWEKKAVDEYFTNYPKLLLIAAGGGREVYHLLKMGFEVDAYECHPGLTDFANKLLIQEGFNSSVKVAPRDKCPAGNKKYDSSIVGWGAYTHILGRERRIKFLKEIREQLNENAPLLVSFWARVGNSWRHKSIAYIGNTLRFCLNRERLEIGDDININFVHYFTEQEIRSEMKEAGFNLIFYSRKPYGHAVGVAVNN